MKLCVLFGNLLGIPNKGGNDYVHAFYLSKNDAGKISSFTGGMAQKGKSTREGLVVDPEILLLDKATAAKKSSLIAAKTLVSAQQQKPAKETPASSMQYSNKN